MSAETVRDDLQRLYGRVIDEPIPDDMQRLLDAIEAPRLGGDEGGANTAVSLNQAGPRTTPLICGGSE